MVLACCRPTLPFLFLDQQSIFCDFLQLCLLLLKQRQGIERQNCSIPCCYLLSPFNGRDLSMLFYICTTSLALRYGGFGGKRTNMGNVATVAMHGWKFGNSI